MENKEDPSDMAENEAMIMADHVIDAILQQGAKHQYERYLQPKILPYAAASITNE